ncbi:Protein IDA-LIKE 2, partial [Quillaja saponaria]
FSSSFAPIFSSLKLPSYLSLSFFFLSAAFGQKMGRRIVNIPVLMMVVLLLIYMVGQSDGSRSHTLVFKMKPKSKIHSPPTFLGLLPKGMQVPPSGPSRRNNGLGLQGSWRSP